MAKDTRTLLLIGGIGIAAFMLTRRTAGATVAPSSWQGAVGKVSAATGLTGLLSSVGNIFKPAYTPTYQTNAAGTIDGKSSVAWDTSAPGIGGGGSNNPSAYVAGDGTADNPVYQDAYDYYATLDTGFF